MKTGGPGSVWSQPARQVHDDKCEEGGDCIIAAQLVMAQHTAAILTTFNECDMSAVQELRKTRQEEFMKKHAMKLGLMSFFVKACIDALKQFPAINAEVRGSNSVYHNYYDIGVAIGGGKGLVVPVLRNATI